MSRPPLALTLVTGLVSGVIATMAKGKAEDVLQPQAEKLWPPSAREKATVIGADPADHPDNMPPAVVVDRAAGAVGQQLDDGATGQAAEGVHWSLGLGSAVAYAVLAERVPAVRAGYGVPAGLALYTATHGSVLPALGVQRYPWNMPRAAVAWEAGSHVVYGAAVDVTLRGFDRLRARLGRR